MQVSLVLLVLAGPGATPRAWLFSSDQGFGHLSSSPEEKKKQLKEIFYFYKLI